MWHPEKASLMVMLVPPLEDLLLTFPQSGTIETSEEVKGKK